MKSLKWYKNVSEILNLANVTIEGNKLKFSDLNHSIHNGLYKCQIELTIGQNISSDGFNMTIYCKFKYISPMLIILIFYFHSWAYFNIWSIKYYNQ